MALLVHQPEPPLCRTAELLSGSDSPGCICKVSKKAHKKAKCQTKPQCEPVECRYMPPDEVVYPPAGGGTKGLVAATRIQHRPEAFSCRAAGACSHGR
jgi:hypothetical protein